MNVVCVPDLICLSADAECVCVLVFVCVADAFRAQCSSIWLSCSDFSRAKPVFVWVVLIYCVLVCVCVCVVLCCVVLWHVPWVCCLFSPFSWRHIGSVRGALKLSLTYLCVVRCLVWRLCVCTSKMFCCVVCVVSGERESGASERSKISRQLIHLCSKSLRYFELCCRIHCAQF